VVVFLGNSLTAGLGVSPDSAFPAVVQRMIDSAGLDFRVVNAGVSGATSADGLQQVDWLLRQPADILVLELGGNDALRGLSVEAMENNLRGIIERFRARHPELPVVVAGMEAPPNLGPTYTAAFRAAFRDVARAEHAALIPFLLQDVGGIPSLNQPDHIHPTAPGHAIVARNVWRVLGPVLRRVQAEARTPAA
jgi:acyl-CoA thioesterase-1